MSETYDAVSLKILWDRLVAIADEIVSTLVRTSFSIAVREGGDLSCVLFDGKGRQIAQGSYSLPSFCGTAPQTLRAFLAQHPPESLRPGDVIMSNDPWMGTGHLFDINVVRPVFRSGRIVGYTLSITHLPDIGGPGLSAGPTEVYAEGLRLPVVKLLRAGELNRELIEIIETNVRLPEQVIGDLMANVACNEVGGRALLEFMDEYGIEDLSALSEAINAQSERAMRDQIRAMPDGTWSNRVTIEGATGPIDLAVTVTIAGDEVTLDYTGTGAPVHAAINVPMCYTRAMSYYVLKALTIPSLPNNDGASRPVTIKAPEDCILNAQPPFPTGGRHSVGHFIVPTLLGAFAEALPDRVQADVAMMNVFNMSGWHRNGQRFASLFFISGGLGAMQGLDGRANTPAPSNMTVVPTEVWENLTSMTIESRVLRPDSGGPGEWRGGVGQEVAVRNDTGRPFSVGLLGQRTSFPAKGYAGGGEGALREYRLDGTPIDPKGRHDIPPGGRFVTFESGGGGYGDPKRRPPAKVLKDVQDGAVTVEGALRDYGVRVDLAEGRAERIGAAAAE